MAIEAIKLFKNTENEYSDSKEIELCLGLIYALFQKFVDNEYQTKLGTMLIEEDKNGKIIEYHKNLLDVLTHKVLQKL